MARCINCGELVEEDLIDTVGGLVCQDCFDNEYGYCGECDRVHHLDNMIWFNDNLYCDDCYNEVVGTCELQYRKRYELLQQRCLGGLDFTGLKWCFGTVFALLEDILHFIPFIPKHLTFAFATNPVRVRLQGVFLVMVPSQR